MTDVKEQDSPTSADAPDPTVSSGAVDNTLAAAVGVTPGLGGQEPVALDGEKNTDSQSISVLAPLDVPADAQYYANDLDPNRRLSPRGSVYLDHQERLKAEIARAAVEGRDPDLLNPGPTAGAPLLTAGRLHNPNNQNLSVNALSTASAGTLEGPSSFVEREKAAKGEVAEEEEE